MSTVARSRALDNAPMYFVVDLDREVSGQQSAHVWQRLWELRHVVPVAAILPAVVSSACALLPDEAADGLLVASLTQVPRGSAWAQLVVDLRDHSDRNGVLRLCRLEAALRCSVEKGERLHDDVPWTSASQRVDSRVNRRLSVFVRGWGDLVARRRQDPGAHATLVELRGLAAHVAKVLDEASRQVAASRGHCPALDVAGARVQRHSREMKSRWQRAVADHALRHRNLLTLSPWDVFVRDRPADLRHANLLPLLREAHSVSLWRDVSIAHWNASEFKGFHDRVAAILRRSGGRSLIAKQV